MSGAIGSAPAELVRAKLKGVKETASGWVALCPAHNDANPSLSLSVAENGDALLHCHRGCPASAIVEKLGLAMSDLFAHPRESGRAGPDPRNRARLVRSYDYRDADGTVLFQTCRFEPKTFRQRRPE